MVAVVALRQLPLPTESSPQSGFWAPVQGRLDRAAQFRMATRWAFVSTPLLRNSLLRSDTPDTNSSWDWELAAICAISSLSVQPWLDKALRSTR
jgi:hypothetical protein